MVTKKWITFFSQTGSEIVDIAEKLDRWPDLIITNKRPDHLRTINPKLEGKVVFLENKPTSNQIEEVLQYFDNPVITLHGWLRVMPPEVCNKYTIFNGHPGLITDYPELKGKDPQVKTWQGIKEGRYPVAGAVIHKVTAGVDEGPVKFSERFNTGNLEDIDDLFKVLRDRSLYMWLKLLEGIVVKKK